MFFVVGTPVPERMIRVQNVVVEMFRDGKFRDPKVLSWSVPWDLLSPRNRLSQSSVSEKFCDGKFREPEVPSPSSVL